ncbi:MAG: spore coat associated protein CotJA [Bacillota bacterium]
MKGQSETELARAYIKDQQYTKRYSPMEGLQKGTIFPELYMPYEKKGREPAKREPQWERESWRSFGRGGRNGQR